MMAGATVRGCPHERATPASQAGAVLSMPWRGGEAALRPVQNERKGLRAVHIHGRGTDKTDRSRGRRTFGSFVSGPLARVRALCSPPESHRGACWRAFGPSVSATRAAFVPLVPLSVSEGGLSVVLTMRR
jgi:hypothetical protein